jgi:hypothetical protein
VADSAKVERTAPRNKRGVETSILEEDSATSGRMYSQGNCEASKSRNNKIQFFLFVDSLPLLSSLPFIVTRNGQGRRDFHFLNPSIVTISELS